MQARLTTKPVEQVVAAIQALDLESVKLRAMDAELGEGWSREYADSIEVAYKNYLTMLAKYQDHAEDILLSKDVDEFWHTHILQTIKYTEDCEKTFGGYVHHSPHVGERTPEDTEKRVALAEKTRKLYEQEFGDGNSTAWSGSISGAESSETIKTGEVAWSSVAVKADYAAWSSAAVKAEKSAAWSSAALRVGEAAWSSVAVKAENAAWSSAAIKAGNAAWSSAAVKVEKNAAWSSAAIRVGEAAWSSVAIKAENAAWSSAAIGAGNAAWSSAAVKAEKNAAWSSAAIRVGEAAWSSVAVKAENTTGSSAATREEITDHKTRPDVLAVN